MLAYTNVYEHYYLLGLPLFVVAAAAAGTDWHFIFSKKTGTAISSSKRDTKTFKQKITSAMLICITVIYALLSVYSACAPIYKTYLTDIAYNDYKQVETGISVIPEEERDEVIAYSVLANFYYHADILPCYRYFTLQKWMTTDKVNVYEDFLRYLIEERPLWVIVRAEEKDQYIRAILGKFYACKSADGRYEYYRCLEAA